MAGGHLPWHRASLVTISALELMSHFLLIDPTIDYFLNSVLSMGLKTLFRNILKKIDIRDVVANILKIILLLKFLCSEISHLSNIINNFFWICFQTSLKLSMGQTTLKTALHFSCVCVN